MRNRKKSEPPTWVRIFVYLHRVVITISGLRRPRGITSTGAIFFPLYCLVASSILQIPVALRRSRKTPEYPAAGNGQGPPIRDGEARIAASVPSWFRVLSLQRLTRPFSFYCVAVFYQNCIKSTGKPQSFLHYGQYFCENQQMHKSGLKKPFHICAAFGRRKTAPCAARRTFFRRVDSIP